MAKDVITRFKLETTQYDSKLRDAAKGLAEYSRTATNAGKEFDKFTKSNVDAARALGATATSTQNAKDQVKELVGAFNDVAKVYNDLTKEQQQSDFGKALAGSMQQLQGRIRDAKQELQDISSQAGNAGGVMEALAKKFTVNVDALKLLDFGLQATGKALEVARDAFFASEANVDEWGRIIASSEAVYDGFLTALNNGDFSGYLDHIDEIVQAARTAYDELDRLGTMRTIQGPQYSKQEAENNRMRTMLMTGTWISAADGRKSPLGLKDGDKLTPEMMKTIERQLKNGVNTLVGLTKNELGQTGRAIDAYYNSLAKQNGMSLSEFRRGTSNWSEFEKRQQGYANYQKWRNENYYTDNWGNRRVKEGNPYQQYAKWGTFRVDKMGQNSYNDLVGLIRQQQSQTSQMYSQMGQAYRTINRVDGTTVRGIMGGGGGTAGGGRSGGTSPQEKAAERMRAAQDKYAVALEKAQAEFDGGNITEKDLKTAQKRAAESLFEAADDAYRTYADPQYKTVREDAKQKFVNLGGEVKTLTEIEKANQKTAREQEQAQKKLSDALRKQADALERGNLKDYNAATKQVREAEKEVARLGGSAAFENVEHGDINIPVGLKVDDSALKSFTEQVDQKLGTSPIPFQFALNQENIAAVIENLKEQLSRADVGSELFNSLLEKLGNAQLISDSINKGISDNIDGKTGKKRKKDGDSPMDKASKALGGLNSIAGGLEKMGVELPSEFQDLIGVIEGAMSVIQGLQTIISVFQTSAIVANTAALNANTAAMVWTSFLGFKTGGIVPHAAQGFVPGNNYSDNVPLMVSSGELILNRAQQGNLASQLEGDAGLGDLNLSAVIRGEQIRLVLNNNGRRTGRGEYVQSTKR